MTRFLINRSHLKNGEFDLSQVTDEYDQITVDGFSASALSTIVGNFSDNITLLNFADCVALRSLTENLPPYLESLYLSNCQNIKILPTLPNSLKILDISNCTLVTTIENIPDSIKWLYLRNTGLTSLSENLPPNLEIIDASYCQNITTIPTLPDDLYELHLIGCVDLTTLPELLPSDLRYLCLNSCINLRTLPPLPDSLRTLDLAGCTNLELTPELLIRLEDLEVRGCAVYYPPHFNLGGADKLTRSALDEIITKAKILQPDLQTEALEQLIHRFLTEAIAARGGIKEILAVATPVLEFLSQNLLAVEWMNDAANKSLTACINQPVNAMTKVTAFVEVARQKTMKGKLEAVKRIAAQDALEQFMAKLPKHQKPGTHVEVEGGNALLKEVHAMLLANNVISAPWLGIPKKIAYEGAITSWLTQDLIIAAYEAILPTLAQDIFRSADLMCETNHRETWAMVAFGEEFIDFRNKTEDFIRAKLEVLEELKEPEKHQLNQEELKEISKNLPEQLAQELQEFHATFTKENPNQNPERNQLINDLIRGSQIERNQRIAQFIRKRTYDDLPPAPPQEATAVTQETLPNTQPQQSLARRAFNYAMQNCIVS